MTARISRHNPLITFFCNSEPDPLIEKTSGNDNPYGLSPVCNPVNPCCVNICSGHLI